MMRHAGLLAAVGLAGLMALGSGCGSAQASPGVTFTLEEHDHIIAETAGCHAECKVFGLRRTCTVSGQGCSAACFSVPECREGAFPVKVCAIVRTR
jgi:hypothetical protein